MREGLCTTALVHYLVYTHNNFIERCRDIVSQGAESAAAVWRAHKIPIAHIHRCHLLEYEQHLQSIILSHCHYSLTVGRGQNVKYDLPALEKHILNRFIYGKPSIPALEKHILNRYGKPSILLDIPNVAYRKDIYTAETFLEIRRKVSPQEPLSRRVQQDIITELRTPEKLRESLDVVDIVLGLVSSGGGNHDVTLHKYIKARRMIKKPFSVKAKEHCTLGHILSLWRTISVELARQLWHTGQEPFEGIPEKYSKPLEGDQENELNKCLRTFDLELLLESLFEFIEVHVKYIAVTEEDSSIDIHDEHIAVNEEDFSLIESLGFYWEKTKQNPIDLDQLGDDFPERITVPQAVATWKHVTEYKDNKH